MHSKSCEMLGWMTRWNQDCQENNLRYADDTTLMAEGEEELKSLLLRGKEEREKNWLKTQHSKNENHGIHSYHFTANR